MTILSNFEQLEFDNRMLKSLEFLSFNLDIQRKTAKKEEISIIFKITLGSIIVKENVLNIVKISEL